MLSYKLRHLCSRVIASLSAFGLFSITGNGAKAATYTYTPGQTYGSYNVTKNVHFSANMVNLDATALCKVNSSGLTGLLNVDSFGNAINAEIVEKNGVKYCKYWCPSGFLSDEGGVDYVVSYASPIQTGDNGEYLPVYVRSGCLWVENALCKATGTNSNFVSADFVAGYYVGENAARCLFECKDGYYLDAEGECGYSGMLSGCGTGETGWIGYVVEMSTGTALEIAEYGKYVFETMKSCEIGKFYAGFDCGDVGIMESPVSGDGIEFVRNSDGDVIKASKMFEYGADFVIPESFKCSKPGYDFKNWESDTEFKAE